MLGMDNYYGAPFWMVNNGGPQWREFDRLFNSETYHTDDLTNQWFCLIHQYASYAVDAYKAQYFANARALVDMIPPDIRPGGKSANYVRASTFDSDADTTFIDLKFFRRFGTADQNFKKHREMENLFINKALKYGVRFETRGSFGFYYPNWIEIPSRRTVVMFPYESILD